MDSTLVTRAPLRALTVRHIGPYPEIGAAFARLESAIDASGVLTSPAPLVALYHDNPETTPASALRSDAGILVDEKISVPSTLHDTTIAGGKYLHVRHLGSYEGLAGTWADLRAQGFEAHGVRRREGPAYEVYPNNPGNAATEALITDIYVPVE